MKPLRIIKKEKDGLVDVGTWIEEEIVSKSDVLAWATRTSNVIHFGNLMIILSVKGSELSPDQWQLKARIVFRGDDIRDQSGMSAVFEELFASSPSSLEGLNTAVAFGLLVALLPVMLYEPTRRLSPTPNIALMFFYRQNLFRTARSIYTNRAPHCTKSFMGILNRLLIGRSICMRFSSSLVA